VQSHTLFRELVVPEIVKKDKPILFVVIDNLRYDQWKTFESEVSNYYKLEKKSLISLFFLRRPNMLETRFSLV
jgi:hypothetical protein